MTLPLVWADAATGTDNTSNKNDETGIVFISDGNISHVCLTRWNWFQPIVGSVRTELGIGTTSVPRGVPSHY